MSAPAPGRAPSFARIKPQGPKTPTQSTAASTTVTQPGSASSTSNSAHPAESHKTATRTDLGPTKKPMSKYKKKKAKTIIFAKGMLPILNEQRYLAQFRGCRISSNAKQTLTDLNVKNAERLAEFLATRPGKRVTTAQIDLALRQLIDDPEAHTYMNRQLHWRTIQEESSKISWSSSSKQKLPDDKKKILLDRLAQGRLKSNGQRIQTLETQNQKISASLAQTM